MKSLHIRDVPEPVLKQRISKRAQAHHRSLQGEVLSIPEKATLAPPAQPIEPFKPETVALSNSQTTWSRKELYGDPS